MTRHWTADRPARVLATGFLAAATLAGCGGPDAVMDELAVRRGGDLVAARANVSLHDTIPGDAMVAGGDIEFTGVAGGDFLGAGGRQRIAGRVDGSVRAAGGEVELDARVGRNATVAGGSVRLAPGSDVEGNAYLTGGRVSVAGRVGGLLRVGAGEADLTGRLDGDVLVAANQLHIGPGTVIGGDLRYRVPEDNVYIDPGVEVGGQVIAQPAPRDMRRPLRWLQLILNLGFLVAGLVVIALFPGAAARSADALHTRPAPATGIGLLWLVGLPVAASLVALTVVGIPLALIAGVAYVVSLYLGRAVVGLWLGRLILGDRLPAGTGGVVLGFLLGAAILFGLGFVPYAGAVITVAASIVGVGAWLVAVARPQAVQPVEP